MDEKSLKIMVTQLQPLIEGCFIAKIHQMTPYHLLLRLRGGGRQGELRLLAAIAARGQSLHLTTRRYLNPPRPLRFLSYLRHHFQGGRICALEKLPGERIVILRGRRREGEEKQLIIELTGKSANMALASGPEMIIGARMLDLPGGGRLLPGKAWRPPAAGPGGENEPLTLRAATGKEPAGLAPETLFSLYDDWYFKLYQEYYGTLEIRRLVKDLKRQVKRLDRRERKLATEYRNKEKHLDDARLADLFKPRLAEIRRGDRSIRVVDYWSENLEEIEIPLDPALSPRANLERLYKNTRKAKRGLELISARRLETAREKSYLEEIIYQLEELGRAVRDEAEIGDEVEELMELAAGLAGSRPPAGKAGKRGKKEPRPQKGPAGDRTRGTERFAGVAGGTIYLGRNALGNENIYRRLSSPKDLWFHVRNRPGAHVLLKTAPGRDEDAAELEQAARLAARHSRARGEKRVEVTVCRIKHLKKPPRSRPGLLLVAGPSRTLTVAGNCDD